MDGYNNRNPGSNVKPAVGLAIFVLLAFALAGALILDKLDPVGNYAEFIRAQASQEAARIASESEARLKEAQTDAQVQIIKAQTQEKLAEIDRNQNMAEQQAALGLQLQTALCYVLVFVAASAGLSLVAVGTYALIGRVRFAYAPAAPREKIVVVYLPASPLAAGANGLPERLVLRARRIAAQQNELAMRQHETETAQALLIEGDYVVVEKRER